MISVKEYYELLDASKNSSASKTAYENTLSELAALTDSKEFFKGDKRRQEERKEILKKLLDSVNTAKKPRLHIILGSIASGKTSLKEEVIKEEKEEKEESYLYINYDSIKKELVEYEALKRIAPKLAAKFVQSESAKMAAALFDKSLKKKINRK